MLGGTVNGSGTIWMRATRIGQGSLLSQIVRLMESAQMSKAPIQALADRISGVFVPVVVLLALLTLLTWYGVVCVVFVCVWCGHCLVCVGTAWCQTALHTLLVMTLIGPCCCWLSLVHSLQQPHKPPHLKHPTRTWGCACTT